jgi:cytochrome c oxidase assembly protein subunit 15
LVKKSLLSRLALFASVFALGVIALGAFTRLIDAGLGCPDWPGCYGQLSVPVTKTAQQLADLQYPATPLVAYKAWAEMAHRYVVGGLSFLILAIIAVIFSQKNLRTRTNTVFALCLILLLTYQIMLGQWTVTLKLLPLVVTQHLLGGFLILAMLWLIYLNNAKPLFTAEFLRRKAKRAIVTGAIVAVVLLVAQIILGAWTSTNYASLSCPDFPFCFHHHSITLHFKSAFNIFSPLGINYEGGVLPEAARQTIQMTHRVGALVVTLYLFIFMSLSMPQIKRFPELMAALYLVLGLLCIQLCIGISNVIFELPLVTALSHTVFAVLLLLAMITFTFKLINTNYKGAD